MITETIRNEQHRRSRDCDRRRPADVFDHGAGERRRRPHDYCFRHDHQSGRRGRFAVRHEVLSCRRNSVLDGNDTPLGGSHAVPDLAPGGSHSASTSLTLPAVAVGTYYIIAKADDDNVVLESRGDEQHAGAVDRDWRRPRGDDVDSARGGRRRRAAHGQRRHHEPGRRIGRADDHEALSVSRQRARRRRHLARQPRRGRARRRRREFRIDDRDDPGRTRRGPYYIVAKADADGSVVETYETNNTPPRSILIGSDLYESAMTVPAKGGAGATISVSDTTGESGRRPGDGIGDPVLSLAEQHPGCHRYTC